MDSEKFLLIRIAAQLMELRLNERVVTQYIISTSQFGLGFEPNSFKTPLGLHRIAQKIGDELPVGAVLKGRIWTGSVWSPEDPYQDEGDLILSRILWLEGLEENNRTTFDRYIYIHGTNQEHLLGRPASHGCIRMGNKEIVELFNQVQTGTHVRLIKE